jgi:hypothetical protein
LLEPAGEGGICFLLLKYRADVRDEKRRELKRTKAEEIFDELGRLERDHGKRVHHAISVIAKKETELQAEYSTDRLDALLSIYFPTCVALLDAYRAETTTMLLNAAETITETIKTRDPEQLDGLNLILSNELNKRTQTFSKALRTALRKEVESLWASKGLKMPPSSQPSRHTGSVSSAQNIEPAQETGRKRWSATRNARSAEKPQSFRRKR